MTISDRRRAATTSGSAGREHGSIDGPSRSMMQSSTAAVQYAARIPPPDAATSSAGSAPSPVWRANHPATTSSSDFGVASAEFAESAAATRRMS